MTKKLIVIGVDGGNAELIKEFSEKGIIKNLRKFKRASILKSTMPPGTAVSWASFSTGNQPGKTQIYDFTVVDENSWKINFVNRKSLKGKPLWQYLSEAGLKSCFINLPISYPPDKINGVLISGIDAPSKLSNYVYPPELKTELDKAGYEIEVSSLQEKDKMVQQAVKILDNRVDVANTLLKKNFDFFVVLFRESDVVQHYAWGKKEVEEVYKKIDDFIGRTKEYAKKIGAEIIIMSDHGSEKVDKAFNVNVWLENEGYLKINKKGKSILSAIGISKENIFKILDKLKAGFLIKMIPRTLGKRFPTKEVDFEEAIITGLIDLKNTRAIAKRAVKTAQIFLNKKKRGGIVDEREEDSLIDEIKNKLMNFFNKQNIKAEIKTKTELYGKNAINAPDITLYLKERGYDVLTLFSEEKKLWDKTKENATHITEGILFCDLNLKLDNARIIDLTPTILDYFGLKKNAINLDGKSLL